MKKFRLLGVLLAITVAVMALSSYVTAYMRKQTPRIENPVPIGQVSCVIKEVVSNNTKTHIEIQNTSNIPVYIRVAFISYWQDEDGNIVYEASKSVAPVYNGTDWFTKDGYYYYTKAINPPEGETKYGTGNILGNNETIPLVTKEVNGKQLFQVVDVIVEAIQANPSDAAEEVWGVKVSDSGILSYSIG